MHAVEGNVRSGEVVATIIMSISSALIWQFFKRFSEALNAKSEVNSDLSAMWRCLIPVLSTIHSSLVSTSLDKSKFVTILLGTYEPVATIFANIFIFF